MAEVKCKVCGHPFPLTETFCPECGFERHVLPETVSKEVEEYEENRAQMHKKHRETIVRLNKENSDLNQRLTLLEQQIEARENNLTKVKADLRKALEEAGKSNLSDLKGIVIISDMTHIDSSDMSTYAITPINRQCLPVLSGENTYGSADSSGNHHQISIKCRGNVFLPKHFAVDTTHSKGLVIKDLSNGMITLDGNRFEEEYTGNSKFFIQQGRQVFVVEIKKLNI